MRTVHCPLCGLRFAHGSELDAHAVADHMPHREPRVERLVVHRARPEPPVDRHGEVIRLPW